MKKTLTSMLVIAALSLTTGLALAQDAGTDRGAARGDCPGHHGRGRGHGPMSAEGMERRIAHMTERLSLDAHQVTLVREILTAARTEGEALRAAERSPERRAQFQALHARVEAQIDAILTDAQRTTLAAMRAERHERMEARRARRGERGEGARGEGARGGRGGRTAPAESSRGI